MTSLRGLPRPIFNDPTVAAWATSFRTRLLPCRRTPTLFAAPAPSSGTSGTSGTVGNFGNSRELRVCPRAASTLQQRPERHPGTHSSGAHGPAVSASPLPFVQLSSADPRRRSSSATPGANERRCQPNFPRLPWLRSGAAITRGLDPGKSHGAAGFLRAVAFSRVVKPPPRRESAPGPMTVPRHHHRGTTWIP